MASAFQILAREIAANPLIAARIAATADEFKAKRLEREAQERAQRQAEDWAREQAADRACAISAAIVALEQKRRQGGSPDAAIVESETAEVEPFDVHEDTEFRCATCDSTNVTLGMRSGSDENGAAIDDEGGWCWDCDEFVEVVEVAIPDYDPDPVELDLTGIFEAFETFAGRAA